jgi:phytoene dehydrogenase-like protein
VAQKWQVFNYDRYRLIENESGKVFTWYCDPDRMEQQMMEFAPEDEEVIREFCKTVRKCLRFDMSSDKPPELYGLVDSIKMVKMLPMLMFMRKWGKISIVDYARRFKNPFLRYIIGMASFEEFSDMPAWTIPWGLAWHHQKAVGYIIDGAMNWIGTTKPGTSLYKFWEELGVAQKWQVFSDFVISAADGRATIFDMLDSKYIDDKICSYYDNLGLFPPLVYIGLGVARKFDDVPPSLIGFEFPLEKPVTIAGKDRKNLNVLLYNFDSTLAPEGKTVVRVQFNTDYDYWERLYKEPERYKAEKEQIADTVVSLLDKRFPGLAGLVEMRDVATPMTWVRYTGNWKGSYMGWLPTTNTFMMRMKKTLPGLDNFYMAGQWVNPGGGMSTAAISGNHTIQLICKKDKKKFLTSNP